MRVLCWTDWYLPSIGGVEVFLGRLLPALAGLGHEITVVAGHHVPGLPDRVEADGVTVLRYPFHRTLAAGDPGPVAQMVREIARLEAALAPDVVHLHTLGPSILFHLRTAGRRRVPTLVTLHSPVLPDAGRPDTLSGQALRSAFAVACTSRAVQAELCRLVPGCADRSSVIYCGAAAPAVVPSPLREEAPRILGYGRLVPEKGFDLLVLAFADVARHAPGARLAIAGEGPARPGLERLAGTCGIRHRVDFLGAVPPERVSALVDTAFLVVVPSRWAEPFGLVALEAALMERPVVAARVGGLPEAVEHGRTGLLVEPDDAPALARAITRMLADPATARRLGRQARARALDRFSLEACTRSYQHLLARGRPLCPALETR